MHPITSHATTPLSPSSPRSPKTGDVLGKAPTSPDATPLDTFQPSKTEAIAPSKSETIEPKEPLPPAPTASHPGRLRRSWDFLKNSLSGAGALLMQGGRLVANAVMSMGQAAGETITSFVSRFTKKTADKAEAAADETAKFTEAVGKTDSKPQVDAHQGA